MMQKTHRIKNRTFWVKELGDVIVSGTVSYVVEDGDDGMREAAFEEVKDLDGISVCGYRLTPEQLVLAGDVLLAELNNDTYLSKWLAYKS